MNNLYSRESATRALRSILLLRPLSQIATAASLVLIVRVLSESDFGIYSLMLSSLAFVGLVLSLGISNMLQRFVPEYAKSGDFDRAKKIVNAATILRLVSIAVVTVFALIFQDLIISTYNLEGYSYLYLPLLLVVLTHFQSRILLQALPAFMFQDAQLVAQIAFAVFKAAGYGLMAVFGWGLEHVLWIDLTAYLVMLSILTASYLKRVRPLTGGPKTLGPSERKRVAKYAAYYNFNDVGVLGLGRDIDNLFLGALTNPVAVGAYAFAGKLAELILKFSPVRFFYTLIQPMFFTLDRDRDASRVGILASLMLKSNAVVAVPIWAFTAACTLPLLNVAFAGRFSDFVWVIVAVMATGSLSAIIGPPIALVAQLYEKADVVLYSKVFSFLNFLLNLLLIPRFGLLGVVLATGFCTIVKDIFVWWFVRYQATPRRLGLFLTLTVAIWGAYLAFGAFLNAQVKSDVLVLLIMALLTLPVAVVYMRLSIRDAEERAELGKLLGRNRKARVVGRVLGI